MATILVVDDNASNRRLLQHLLASRDHQIVEAANGREGLEVARAMAGKDGLDAVLLDLNMPVLDGYGFLAEWTSDPELHDVPVVVVTASPSDTVRGIEAGALDYVTKPFEIGELLVRIGAALRVKSLQDRLKWQNAKLEALSYTNPLTGLLNRRGLEEQLTKLANAARRHGHNLAVLLADADHFKGVNDKYGHAAGDRVLEELGGRIRACIRSEDVAGRWGGEEFLLVLPFTGPTGASILGERLRGAVAESAFILADGQELGITVSVGGAADGGDDPEALLRLADDALYEAKAGGRNTVRMAPPGART